MAGHLDFRSTKGRISGQFIQYLFISQVVDAGSSVLFGQIEMNTLPGVVAGFGVGIEARWEQNVGPKINVAAPKLGQTLPSER